MGSSMKQARKIMKYSDKGIVQNNTLMSTIIQRIQNKELDKSYKQELSLISTKEMTKQ